MTTSNDFSEYYKTISNSELLTILDNPGDYQTLAVEAAKQEFSYRQLSDEEIQPAKEPGKHYWVKVAAIGSRQQIAYSQVVNQFAQ